MDKSVLITAVILTFVGIVAISFKSFVGWFWNLILDTFMHSLKIDESSQFFYGMQNFVSAELSQNIKSVYYRNIYDNFIDGETTRNMTLFYNRGLIFTRKFSGLLMISKINATINNTMTPYKNEKQSFHIYSFRKKPLMKMVDHVKETYVNNNIRYYFNNNGEIMVYGNIIKKTFDNIFLNDGLKEEIMADLDRFNNSKELYESFGIKYKRTYAFHGIAGAGKSSLGTAIANHTRRDILTINMSKDMTDSTLISLIAKRPPRSIVLFEDIDCLFEELKREEEADKSEKTPLMKISLSCVLNILDGSFTPNDVIFVITTNHIDKLDSALIRKGRVNMLKEIKLPNKETKAAYLQHIAKFNSKFDPKTIDLDNDTSISSLEENIM